MWRLGLGESPASPTASTPAPKGIVWCSLLLPQRGCRFEHHGDTGLTSARVRRPEMSSSAGGKHATMVSFMSRIQRALISVTDKTGVVDFPRALSRLGVEVIPTGSTHPVLQDER